MHSKKKWLFAYWKGREAATVQYSKLQSSALPVLCWRPKSPLTLALTFNFWKCCHLTFTDPCNTDPLTEYRWSLQESSGYLLSIFFLFIKLDSQLIQMWVDGFSLPWLLCHTLVMFRKLAQTEPKSCHTHPRHFSIWSSYPRLTITFPLCNFQSQQIHITSQISNIIFNTDGDQDEREQEQEKKHTSSLESKL